MITTIGNTTYYSTVEEWKAAGMPGGNDTHRYVIGEPPAPGQPETGVKDASGNIIPWEKWDPTQQPTYKPPTTPTITNPPNTGVSTPPTTTASQPSQSILNYEVEDLNKRIASYEQRVAAYNDRIQAFDAKWASYVKEGTFTGSDADYQTYLKEYRAIDSERISLSQNYYELKARSKNVEAKRLKELEKYVQVGENEYILKEDWDKLDPEYQKILKEQGFDALNARISADNKAAIQRALVQSFDRFKNEQGKVDLVAAVKSGLSEHTIALAFGDEKAREAVKAAGPPPPGGWGPKAPTLPQAVGVVTAETLFPPSKQWVEPELHYKATGMDWAVGVAQIALFALPLAGAAAKAGMIPIQAARAATFGAEVGATAIFTKDTVDHWKEMSPIQRAFSVGLDALIAGSALRSGLRVRADVQAAQLANIEARARKIVVDHYLDAVTGRVEAGPKKTFTNIPVAPMEAGKYLPVKAGTRAVTLRTTLEDVSRALRTGNVQLLKESGNRLRLLAKGNPQSPVAGLLEYRGKQLVNHAEDYIKLKEKPLTAAERKAINDALEANKRHADLLERQLKKGIKNPETRKIVEETLKETKRQIKVAEREATRTLPAEKVIMPEEQGKNVPATKKETAVPTKSKPREPEAKPEPRIKSKPTHDTDVQVVIRPAEGGKAVYGWISFPTSDPEGQRRFLRALEQTEVKRGYIIEIANEEHGEIKPSTELELERVRREAELATRRSVRSQGSNKTKESTKVVPRVAATTTVVTEAKQLDVTQVSEPSATESHETEPISKVKPQPDIKKPQPPDVPPNIESPRPPDTSKLKTKPKFRPGKGESEPPPEEWTKEQIANATAIKAGAFWVLRRADGKIKWFRELPPGVKSVPGGKGSGHRSVQTVVGQPIDTEIQLGFARAHIRKPGREPGRPGAVSYAVTTPRRPALEATREGSLLKIKGVGIKRGHAPKGRILRAQH